MLDMDDADPDHRAAVLEESRGGGRRCPLPFKIILTRDLTGTHWNPSDIRKDGVPKDEHVEADKEWSATIGGIINSKLYT